VVSAEADRTKGFPFVPGFAERCVYCASREIGTTFGKIRERRT
jgi:hypothetical protein